MGGPMPSRVVSKTQTLVDMDEKFESAAIRASVLKRIIQGDAWLDILIQEKLMKDQSKRTLFKKKWFGDAPPAYWPGHVEKVNIFIEGFRKALELSLGFGFDPDRPATKAEVEAIVVTISKLDKEEDLAYGTPVVSYWLCAGREFLCLVHKSKYQITLNIMTPSFPENIEPKRAMITHEDIWIVSDAATKDLLVRAAKYPGGKHTEPKPHTRIKDVWVTEIYR